MSIKNIQKSDIRPMMNKEKKTYSTSNDLVKSFLFGVGITNASKKNILEYVLNSLKNRTKPYYIVTPNPEIVVAAQKNTQLLQSLNEAKIALVDGVGLKIGAQMLHMPVGERIRGIDFMEMVLSQVNDWPINIGFLGGRPGVAVKVAERLRLQYPGMRIVFADSEANKLLKLPKVLMPQLLFVAFGAPKQEIWMQENSKTLGIPVMMGVGGAFDQIIDSTLRPLQFVHAIGLGWLYRLVRQPWRWKRQLALIAFTKLIMGSFIRHW